MYINSLVNVGIALNQASFADTYKIGTEMIGKLI